MKTLLFIAQVSLLGLFTASCNRFEAKHEQIPTEDQPDLKDKTKVAQDTASTAGPDTLVR
jgi:alkaline phosphatase